MTRRRIIFVLFSLVLTVVILPALPNLTPVSPDTDLLRARRALASEYAAVRQAGEVNPAADKVYGQSDFNSNSPGSDRYHFNSPSALFVSSETGQIFVADAGNNRVLIWNSVDDYEDGDPADIVIGQPNFTSTVAPNPPTASSLNNPSGLALDFWGNLYVADTGNNRVLVYEPTFDQDDFPTFTNGMAAAVVIGQSNFTSKTAPNPPTAASLDQPMGLAIDYYDNLVVADSDNNRVLIFEPPLKTGMKARNVLGQPLAGNPEYGDFTTRLASPPSEVSLNHPTGVAIGAVADELYVADTGNHRVLVFTKSDSIEAQADLVIGQPGFTSGLANNGGLGAGSLNGPTGLRVDSANRLLVADTGNHRVLQYENPLTSDVTADQVFGQSGSFTTNQAGSGAAGLHGPTAVATDEALMDVYIADWGNHRALQYFDPLPNAVPVITDLYPGTVKAGSDGFILEIWGTGIIDGTVVRVNGAARAVKENYLGLIEVNISAAEAARPGSLNVTLVNPANDWGGGGTSGPKTVTFYQPALGDTTADGVAGQADFNHDDVAFIPPAANTLYFPAGMAVGPDGRVFVADSWNMRVLRWPNSVALTSGQPADLVIGQPDFETTEAASWTGLTARSLDYPLTVAVSSGGTLFVSDTPNNRVLVYSPPLANGMAATAVLGQSSFTLNNTPAAPAADNLNNPLGLAVDAAGRLFVADAAHNRVLVFDPPFSTGKTASLVIGQPNFSSAAATPVSASSLSFPYGLAFDSSGNLFVADAHNNRVLVYTPPFATGMTAGRVFGQAGTFTTNQSGLSAGGLDWPNAVAVDSTRKLLYVADGNNHRVLLYHDLLDGDTTADMVFGQAGSFTSGVANKNGLSADSLNLPMGVAVTAGGTLLVADNSNSRVLTYLPPVAEKVYLPLIRK